MILVRCIGFLAGVLASQQRVGTKTEAETLSECSPTTPATQGHSGGHLRARKPANQDATRTPAAPVETYRLFFAHFHKMTRKYKK